LNLSPELEQQLDSYQAEFAGNLTFNGTLTGNVSNPTFADALRSIRFACAGEISVPCAQTFFFARRRANHDGVLQERDGGNLAFNVNIPSVGTNNISVQATLNNVNTGNLLAALPVEAFCPRSFKIFRRRLPAQLI
jgi:hypothetical protein